MKTNDFSLKRLASGLYKYGTLHQAIETAIAKNLIAKNPIEWTMVPKQSRPPVVCFVFIVCSACVIAWR